MKLRKGSLRVGMKKNVALQHLERIEVVLAQMMTMLDELLTASRRNSVVKRAYSVAEVAPIVKRRPYTVREWCRLHRLNATKRPWGRGSEQEWEISHEELERYQNHGLLPVPKRY